MPLQVVRKVAFWKKSSIKHKGESNNARGDWIADALKVVNLLIVVSDAVPAVGGFIKGAAGVFIALLDPVQQMGKNKEDCKMLIMSIVELLQTVNQELRMISMFEDMTMDPYSNAWSNFEKHVSMFHTFLNRRPYLYPLSSRAMESTKENLIKLNSEGRALSRYIRAQKIQDIILSYQSDMQRLQNNLLLANSLAMRLQVTNIEATTNQFLKKDQKNRNNEDDIEMDDYYQIKPADIHLTQILESSKETVQECLATVYCGGTRRSTMVRIYKGTQAYKNLNKELQLISRIRHPNVTQLLAVCNSKNLPALIFDDGTIFETKDIIDYLLTRYRRSRDARAGISHLVTTLPMLFQRACLDFFLEYTAINSSVSYSYARSGQLQIREYQSTGIDNRIVLALNPTVDYSGYALDPKIYWSTCPSGTTSLTVLQAYSLGIKYYPSLTKTLHALEYVYIPERDILSKMYEACSLNPESDEVSQLLGFPLPERKDFLFPKPKRRLSCSDVETMKRTDCNDSAHFQLPDEQNISENYRTFLTADKVPSFLQSYDLRTTGHELIYEDLDIQPIHEELPIHIKAVVSWQQ
ncbi:hypothetical protein M422DRAFT_253442 [Sphaerobolus stellatus SS14]|uniref:Protein kinase domain-containing protein n=1 Tax=Sphaerobolus stellatus (strain SS14) TaxID=990650 RepID=A0A0C9VWN8_SPHS4|nr:hypothetical protein M422DRAFT_253442 [Sphaerobolus stellatus SS14]